MALVLVLPARAATYSFRGAFHDTGESFTGDVLPIFLYETHQYRLNSNAGMHCIGHGARPEPGSGLNITMDCSGESLPSQRLLTGVVALGAPIDAEISGRAATMVIVRDQANGRSAKDNRVPDPR